MSLRRKTLATGVPALEPVGTLLGGMLHFASSDLNRTRKVEPTGMLGDGASVWQALDWASGDDPTTDSVPDPGTLSVRQLKELLFLYGDDYSGVVDKTELVQMARSALARGPPPRSPSEDLDLPTVEVPPPAAPAPMLDPITELYIGLKIREMKELLVQRGVDFSGMTEKAELLQALVDTHAAATSGDGMEVVEESEQVQPAVVPPPAPVPEPAPPPQPAAPAGPSSDTAPMEGTPPPAEAVPVAPERQRMGDGQAVAAVDPMEVLRQARAEAKKAMDQLEGEQKQLEDDNVILNSYRDNPVELNRLLVEVTRVIKDFETDPSGNDYVKVGKGSDAWKKKTAGPKSKAGKERSDAEKATYEAYNTALAQQGLYMSFQGKLTLNEARLKDLKADESVTPAGKGLVTLAQEAFTEADNALKEARAAARPVPTPRAPRTAKEGPSNQEKQDRERAENYFLNDPTVDRVTGQARRADRGGGQPYGVYKRSLGKDRSLGTQTNFSAWYNEREGFNRIWYAEMNATMRTVKAVASKYVAGVKPSVAIQALLTDPASPFTNADQLRPAAAAASAVVAADDEDADDDEGGGEEAEEGDNASVTTSGKKKKSSVVQHPAVYTKMIELSNAFEVPEWDLIERAYVEKYNRLLSVDLVRASMTRDEAFGEMMTDERYELLFARETGRYDGPIDRLEMTMLDAQRERAEKNIKNLQRKDLKNEAALWEQSKQERMSKMHKQRLDAIDSLQRERRATLGFILKDRRENAESTSDLKRKEQSDIRRERSRLRTERDRLEQLLKRSRDPEEQGQLRAQIAELEGQIEELDEREKTVVQQAKEAEAAAKADEREARFKESLKELAGKLVDESVRVAAAALGLDRHKKTLQNKFDKAAEAVGGMPTPDDMKKIDDIAPQPKYKRSRQENGVEKAKRGEEEVVIPEERERWEIAATRMTREQHDLMFLDEAEVKMQMAEWTSYLAPSAGAGRMDESPTSANLKITSVNGHIRYNGHHFSHMDIDHAASIGVNATESLADRAINSAEPISIDELITAPVVVFNKPYARVVLTEHMLSLRRQQINAVANNANAEFVNVAHSLGDFDETPAGREKLMAIVNKLLPFYESMLKYYHTMMGVKRLMTADAENAVKGLDALVLVNKAAAEKSSRIKEIKKRLIKLGPVKDAYMLEARRLIAYNDGRIPGQLYSPQPYVLPLRIAAPPRVGKSAAALLTASLAKRIGMLTLYSVAPNKTVPLSELQQKLKRLGWRNISQEKKSVKRNAPETWAVPASQGGVFDAQEQARRTFVEGTRINEIGSVNMPYAAFAIDNVPGAKKCGEEAFRYDKTGKRYDTQLIDMIIYSAQTPEDPVRVGAILAKFARSEVVCFHIRDEAQVIAKALKNPYVACHKVDVPPPLELQYLRAFMGNLYALNCLVTATHFPTLLEEKLFGYFGSVDQNLRAGMKADIGFSLIKARPGAKFLPPFVPALRPYEPKGYVSVYRMKEWEPRNYFVGAEKPTLEIRGANFRASRKSKAGGVLFEIDTYIPREAPKPKTPPAAAAAAAGPDPMATDDGAPSSSSAPAVRLPPAPDGPRPAQDSLPAQKYGEDAPDQTANEKAIATAKAVAAANLDEASAYLGRRVGTRRSTRQAQKDKKDYADADDEGAEEAADEDAGVDYGDKLSEPKRKGSSGKSRGTKDKAAQSKLSGAKAIGKQKEGEPQAGAEEEPAGGRGARAAAASGEAARRAAEGDKDSDFEQSGSEGDPESDEEGEDELDEAIALRDLSKIKSHFLEFLDAPKTKTTPPEFPVDVAGAARADAPQTLVPMYIGALNNNIADDGMISFVRSFAKEAHNRYLRGKAVKPRGAPPTDPTRATAADQTKFGCAFILFTTALENRAAIDACNVHLVNAPGEKVPFRPEPPKPPPRVQDLGGVGGLLTGQRPSEEYEVSELDFGGRSTLNRAAIVFVYDPMMQAGINGLPLQVPKTNTPPDLEGKDWYWQTQDVLATDTDSVKLGKQPKLDAFFTSSASDAIKYMDGQYSGRIDKFAVLGYGMLTAGLTVQTYIAKKRKMFCPQYTALASTDQAALDSQLQIAGRSFVDLKQHSYPDDWYIQLLSVEGKLDKLQKYTQMEERFATIGDDGEQKPMYEVLKRGFKTRFIDLDSFNTLGYLGVRRGEFSRILGLTPKAAQTLVKDVQDASKGKTEAEADKALSDKFAQEDAQAAAEAAKANSVDDVSAAVAGVPGAGTPPAEPSGGSTSGTQPAPMV
jgi:hypothetical protein